MSQASSYGILRLSKTIGDKTMLYLGIDVGTAGCKATALDVDGNIRSYAYKDYKAVRTSEGYAEIDPDAVWQTVKHVIARAAAEAGVPVKAVAIASFGETFVAVDKDDRVLRNGILYADVRGSEEIGDIRERFEDQEIYDVTGMPVNAMFTLNKLLWVKKHEPRVYERIDKLFLFEDYLYYKLSGVRCIDYSLASRTMFFDFAKYGWAERVLSAFGLSASMLSKPVMPGSVIGQISDGLVSELGLSRGVLLVAGGHDQICAALGAGVLKTGECVDGIGTSECITTVLGGLGQKQFMRASNFCIEPYAARDKYVTLAFSTTGASILGWFCEAFAKEADRQSVFRVMESECPQGPTDLFVLPHFAGSGTPHMDPFSTGAVLGLRLSTTRGDIYKACMEGICFEMLQNAQLLKSMGTSITSMTCVGGGTKSEMLLQIKSDIMGIPVHRLRSKESGTTALAMLCAVACRDFTNLEEAAKSMVKIDKTFTPNEQYHQVYQERFSIYKNIYSSIVSL